MNTKQLTRVEIKDADKGEIDAVFATLDVVDRDRDVTLKGAFETGAPVRISAWGHGAWKGRLPVGRGSIRETKSEAILEGRFFMDTVEGHDTFVVVKEMSEDDGPGQEWSYGFDVLDSEFGQHSGQKVRFLKKLKVHEVSPVLLGAGIDTRTVAVKEAKELPGGRTANELRHLLREALDDVTDTPAANAWMYVVDFTDEWVVYECEGSGWAAPGIYQREFTVDAAGTVNFGDAVEVEARREYVAKAGDAAGMKFSEQLDAAVAAVSAVLTRGEEVITFRTAHGKSRLSETSVDVLGRLDAEMKRLDAMLREASPPTTNDEIAREFARFVGLTQGVQR